MLKAALSGGYVNFGVLRLYGDDALDNAIGIFVKMLETIEQRDIMVGLLRKDVAALLRMCLKNGHARKHF